MTVTVEIRQGVAKTPGAVDPHDVSGLGPSSIRTASMRARTTQPDTETRRRRNRRGANGTEPGRDLGNGNAPPPPGGTVEPSFALLARHSAVVRTDAEGDFELTYEPAPAVRRKLTGFVTCLVELQAGVPEARLRRVEVEVRGIGADSVIAALNDLLDDIRYRIAFDGLQRLGLITAFDRGELTTDWLAGRELDLRLHHHPGNPLVLDPPGLPPISYRVNAPEIFSGPLVFPGVSTNPYGEAFTTEDRHQGEHHYEIVDLTGGGTVLRSPPLAIRTSGRRTDVAFITRAAPIPIGVGEINAGLPDRSYQSGIIIKDLDVDIVGQTLRVRGEAGVGTGRNAMLMTVASFDARVALVPKRHGGLPFTEENLVDLFDVELRAIEVDGAPATDIDNIPWYIWVLLLPFAPSLVGWRLIVAAIEAVVEPVATTVILAQFSARVIEEAVGARQEVLEQIEAELASESEITDADMQAIGEGMWLEIAEVTADPQALYVHAFAGTWLDDYQLAFRVLGHLL
jgi:hypothetical protein